MRTPRGGLWPALVALLAAVAFILATSVPAVSATRHDTLPLHAGSSGPRVANLQWELHVPRPKQNVFKQVRGTFKWKPNGSFGARTKSAVTAYKWRLGYPQKGQCGAKGNEASTPTAGALFFKLLEGKATRPACWVALAAGRLKAINVGPTGAALKIRDYENHLVTLGIREIPDGSNGGPCISVACGSIPALQSATGAYFQAWCVSSQQTISKLLGFGTFADDTASVYATVDYAAAHKLVSAKAKIGALVDFIDYDSRGVRIPGTGHEGFVVAVQANSFTYDAGNDANGWRQHTIAFGSRSYLFVYRPGIA